MFKTDFESFQSCSEAIENIKLQKDMVNKLNILIRLNNKPKSCSSSHVTGVNSCDKLIDNSDKSLNLCLSLAHALQTMAVA